LPAIALPIASNSLSGFDKILKVSSILSSFLLVLLLDQLEHDAVDDLEAILGGITGLDVLPVGTEIGISELCTCRTI
jgi:hypothetical protein